MKHDYNYASTEFERVINKTVSDGNYKAINVEEFFDDWVVETIRHALAMMQKLENPSDGMIQEGADSCGIFRDEAQMAFKAMLEQAEKEITK